MKQLTEMCVASREEDTSAALKDVTNLGYENHHSVKNASGIKSHADLITNLRHASKLNTPILYPIKASPITVMYVAITMDSITSAQPDVSKLEMGNDRSAKRQNGLNGHVVSKTFHK